MRHYRHDLQIFPRMCVVVGLHHLKWPWFSPVAFHSLSLLRSYTCLSFITRLSILPALVLCFLCDLPLFILRTRCIFFSLAWAYSLWCFPRPTLIYKQNPTSKIDLPIYRFNKIYKHSYSQWITLVELHQPLQKNHVNKKWVYNPQTTSPINYYPRI